MKKTINILPLMLVLALSTLLWRQTEIAYASVKENEFDKVFTATIENLSFKESYAEHSIFSAQRDLIYDYQSNPLGYLYDFTLNGEQGYGIMTVQNSQPTITEVYFKANNPFRDVETIAVFSTNRKQ